MAKKNYKTGFAALLEPTTTEADNLNPGTVELAEEQEEGLFAKIPASLKIKFDIYCAENRIKKNVAVTRAISMLID